MEKLIEVFNLGGLPTAPLDSFLELQEDFKKSDPDKLSTKVANVRNPFVEDR